VVDKPKRFIISLGDDGVCTFCLLAGKNPDPLPYPPIRIPTKPTYEVVDDDPPGGVPVGRWKWDYRNACIPCAKKLIKKIKQKHIDPMED